MQVEERMKTLEIKDKSKVFNTSRVEALELENLIEVAKATMVSAEARQESRGAHCREDFAARDDERWLKHSLYYRVDNQLAYKPVCLKPLTVDRFPIVTRTY
jgi:succinate dehydrogenase / fumarate reductase flavoprotein subunit